MEEIKLYTFKFEAMTTPCEVQIYEKNQTKAVECFEKIKQNTLLLEKKYNFYDKSSYLNKTINNRKRNKVNIDLQTLEILEIVKDLSLKTDGVFDISVGTINHCYKKNTIEKIENCLLELKNKMGLNSWFIKDKKLHFQYKETKLDLGGVIKEYAVDYAANIVRNYGIKSALINFGGDIITVGLKPNNEPFCIGIKNPKNPSENLVYVNISNQALTTSASYERKTRVENKEFSHIIETKAMKSDIVSSTIISNSTLVSGVFSTAFMINPSCNIYDNLQVLLIDENLNIHQNLS